MQRLIEARAEIEEASLRIPQDIPYQHLRNAMVAIDSFLADLEAASVVKVAPIAPADPDPVLL